MKKVSKITWCVFLVLLLSMVTSVKVVESSRTRSSTVRIYPQNCCPYCDDSGAVPRGDYENSENCSVILSPHEGFGYVDFFFCPEEPWRQTEGRISKVKIKIKYESGGLWNDGLKVKIARQHDRDYNYGRKSSWEDLANFKGGGYQSKYLTIYGSELQNYIDYRDWMLILKLEADSMDWFKIFYIEIYYEYELYN